MRQRRHRPAAPVPSARHAARRRWQRSAPELVVSLVPNFNRVQLILLCGHHAGLLRSLRRVAPHAANPFTHEVPGLMRLADFLFGKPGPGFAAALARRGRTPMGALESYRERVQRIDNRAVYEVVEILTERLAGKANAQRCAASSLTMRVAAA